MLTVDVKDDSLKSTNIGLFTVNLDPSGWKKEINH